MICVSYQERLRLELVEISVYSMPHKWHFVSTLGTSKSNCDHTVPEHLSYISLAYLGHMHANLDQATLFQHVWASMETGPL